MTDSIDAVHRYVSTRDEPREDLRVLTMERSYNAGIDDVWAACTDPERLARWFAPVSGDLRLGGHYQIEGNASGKIERCDPPHGFAATWEYDGGISWIDLRLTAEADDRTRFVLEHIIPVNEHWKEYGPGAAGIGWDISLLRLAGHLAGQEMPAEEEWAVTEAGRRFMTLSSSRWCEAGIASGMERDAALAAAERTTIAYTAKEADG